MARMSLPMTAAAILFVATSVLATFVAAIPLGVRADEEQRVPRP